MTADAPNFAPCPHCGSTDAVEIAYGYPSPGMVEAADRGEIVLGGCIVGEESPDFQSRSCDAPLPWVRRPDEEGGFILRCEQSPGYLVATPPRE